MPKLNENIHRGLDATARYLARPLVWLQPKLAHHTFILILSVWVGFLTGSCAVLLKLMIGGVTDFITGSEHFSPYWYLALPLVGFILVVAYQRFIIGQSIAHGTDRLEKDLAEGEYSLPSKLVPNPLIASTFTLGFGGSAGSEGPIATTGAAIGSNLAKACGLDAKTMRLMLAIGAGAGIAGIFKSGVGGALFTIEALGLTMGNLAILSLFTACIVACLTAYVWSGCSPDVAFTPVESFSPEIIPAVLCLGIFTGLYGAYYSATGGFVARRLGAMKSKWLKAACAGIGLGVMLMLFPMLYGEGYGVLARLINDYTPNLTSGTLYADAGHGTLAVLLICGGVLLCKGVACKLTTNGGGVAGEFAPTLFAGAFAGFFFAVAANALFDLGLCTQTFALLGMAGAMSAIIRAPLMAIFITAEMTWNYQFFLPLTLTAVVAYFTAKFVTSRLSAGKKSAN